MRARRSSRSTSRQGKDCHVPAACRARRGYALAVPHPNGRPANRPRRHQRSGRRIRATHRTHDLRRNRRADRAKRKSYGGRRPRIRPRRRRRALRRLRRQHERRHSRQLVATSARSDGRPAGSRQPDRRRRPRADPRERDRPHRGRRRRWVDAVRLRFHRRRHQYHHGARERSQLGDDLDRIVRRANVSLSNAIFSFQRTYATNDYSVENGRIAKMRKPD